MRINESLPAGSVDRNIGGIQGLTLIDYPGTVAAIIFVRGCNLRCGYCHNRSLVWPEEYTKTLPEGAVEDFLSRRAKVIDGVVITGGEPSLFPKEVNALIDLIHGYGLKVKIDTNGTNPDFTASIVGTGKADYVAMDVKAPTDKYQRVTGCNLNLKNIVRSVNILKSADIPVMFRTTFDTRFLEQKDIEEIRQWVGPETDRIKYVVNPCIL